MSSSQLICIESIKNAAHDDDDDVSMRVRSVRWQAGPWLAAVSRRDQKLTKRSLALIGASQPDDDVRDKVRFKSAKNTTDGTFM